MKKDKFTRNVLSDLHSHLEEDLSDVLDNMSSYPDEIEFIRQCLKKIDVNFSHLMCYAFWKNYSLQSSAGWLVCSDESEVLKEAKRLMGHTPRY